MKYRMRISLSLPLSFNCAHAKVERRRRTFVRRCREKIQNFVHRKNCHQRKYLSCVAKTRDQSEPGVVQVQAPWAMPGAPESLVRCSSDSSRCKKLSLVLAWAGLLSSPICPSGGERRGRNETRRQLSLIAPLMAREKKKNKSTNRCGRTTTTVRFGSR